MTYAVEADAVAQLGEREVIALTDRDNVGTIDSAVLLEALEKASGEIDIYLSGRYATPIAAVPALIKTYCVDIARYRLSGSDVTDVEAVRTRYKDAIRFLEAVRDGKIKLGAGVAAAPADATQNLATIVEGSGRIFSRSAR